MAAQGLERYTHDSVKGSADLDWSDDDGQERPPHPDRQGCQAPADPSHFPQPRSTRGSTTLLEQLLMQDVAVHHRPRRAKQATIKEGTAQGRMPSATDPDVRHGRKSASKRFNGHKADVAVDQDSQLIVAFAVLAGDAGDASGALSLVEQAEANTGLAVSETSADCAYGGGPTRAAFAEVARDLRAGKGTGRNPAGLTLRAARWLKSRATC